VVDLLSLVEQVQVDLLSLALELEALLIQLQALLASSHSVNQ